MPRPSPHAEPLHTLAVGLRQMLRGRGPHGIHSPLVYQLATAVIPPRPMPELTAVHALVRAARQDPTPLVLPGTDAAEQPSTGRVARRSASPPAKGALLTRLVQWHGARRVLELGTNLGLGSLYLAAGMPPGGALHTVEQNAALLGQARRHWRRLRPGARIFAHEQSFEAFLAHEQPRLGYWDLVYLDGHHAEAPTARYLDALLPHMAAGGLVILDDIHWSRWMSRAWAAAGRRPEVATSVDLLWLGLLFVHRRKPQEAFVLRPPLALLGLRGG